MPALTTDSKFSNSIKKSYQAERTIEPIYSGGKVTISANEDILLSPVEDSLILTDLHTGVRKFSLCCDEDTITSFAMSPDGTYILTASQSLLLRLWNGETGELVRSWKAHEAPVLVMDCDPTSTLMATGSADSTIKVWDIERGFCTHNLKGHSGIVSALKFLPNRGIIKLASGSDDTSIRIWNLSTKMTEFVLNDHMSVIRGLDFSCDGKVLVSSGRDQVLISWDLETGKSIRTLPVFESIEDIKVISNSRKMFNTDDLIVIAGGELGILKIWNLISGEAIMTQEDAKITGASVTSLLYLKNANEVGATMSDHNIIFYSLDRRFESMRQIAGYNEEVLDAIFVGSHDEKIAIVNNTDQIRVYNLETPFCDILVGHHDMILSVATSRNGQFVVSGSKDRTAAIWRQSSTPSGQFQKVGECRGHTESVNAVAFSQKTPSFVITGSEDMTVKLWNFESYSACKPVIGIQARFTIKAHDKGIQSVAVSPNDRIFASASLDKTVKIWAATDGSLLGVLKGHRRGIWCVRFSPVDQVVATASTDKTIKLWSLSDFSCIQTFEGHLNSVLHVEFLSNGSQICTSGSDGLIKVWSIKDKECLLTLDNHDGKVWALGKNSAETHLVSGSTDGRVTIWKDTTAEDLNKERHAFQSRMSSEQNLAVFLLRKDYKNAIQLSLNLKHSMKLLSLLKKVSKEGSDDDSITGLNSVDTVLQNLNDEQLETLLFFARDWNTSTNYSYLVQSILSLVIKSFSLDRLLSLPHAKELVDSLLPYSERHFDHASSLLQQSYLLDFTLFSMEQ